MQLIIFIGIQAVGKSTFYKEKFFKTHLRISLDMLKTRNREKSLFNMCLELRQPVVIDNTNPMVEDRELYIIPAKEHGFKITGYYFSSRISEAIRRNKMRSGKECIPEAGIRAAGKRLVVPTYDEGFDELFYVSIGGNNRFIVKKWLDETR